MSPKLIDQLPTWATWRFTRREKEMLELALQRIHTGGKLEAIQDERKDARSRVFDDIVGPAPTPKEEAA